MIVFLDFEASSLSKKSYPVEVAWAAENGERFSALLKPLREWTDWSADAEKVHGISRDRLRKEGQPANEVAHRLAADLSGHDLFASAPSWDGKWLSVLLRAGGLPRHALRLRRSDDAFREAVRTILAGKAAEREVDRLVAEVIEQTEPPQPAHRALDDALLELHRWRVASARARGVEARAAPEDSSGLQPLPAHRR